MQAGSRYLVATVARAGQFVIASQGSKLTNATLTGISRTEIAIVAILGGGVMISLAVGEWVARRRATQRVRYASRVQPVEGRYLDRVDEELKSFD